jgi:hypothetical protein
VNRWPELSSEVLHCNLYAFPVDLWDSLNRKTYCVESWFDREHPLLCLERNIPVFFGRPEVGKLVERELCLWHTFRPDQEDFA